MGKSDWVPEWGKRLPISVGKSASPRKNDCSCRRCRGRRGCHQNGAPMFAGLVTYDHHRYSLELDTKEEGLFLESFSIAPEALSMPDSRGDPFQSKSTRSREISRRISVR